MTPSAPGSPQRKPRRRWRWHVPPALVHGNETLEGAELLEEIPGAVGLVLWQSVRDVTLWALVRDPSERQGLFSPGAYEQRLREIDAAGVDAAIEAPLRAIAQVCRDPEATTEQELLTACGEISQWAERQGKLAAAVVFAAAGAVAAPAHAAAGLRVGKLARDKAEYPRAETWFRRTIGLGRQAKDWGSYAEAFMGLGNLYLQRGNYPVAKRFHIRGLRAARRHGMRDVQARALHDLFIIAVHTDNSGEALEMARLSFRAYGNSHPRLPLLAHDLAYFWMTRGRFEPALRVFQAVLPHMHQPAERQAAMADIGRAAGGAGNREVFDDAWTELYSYSGEWNTRPGSAAALLDLARGAASLKDWARAERAAAAARDVAARREEARVQMEAEAVLDSVSRRRVAETPTPPAAGDAEEAEADGLAADLLRSLTATAARH